jgi:hemerythrin HHE cation binding domain-containing protein
MSTPFSASRLFRDQHSRLRIHVTKMLEAKTDAEHKTLLAQLAGSVKMHLKAEDDTLYPYLLAHRDAAVRRKAAELQQSMGDLAQSFDAFYAHWIKPGAIAADLPGYHAEMRAVVDALAKRMDLEDRELYDLADRALTAA